MSLYLMHALYGDQASRSEVEEAPSDGTTVVTTTVSKAEAANGVVSQPVKVYLDIPVEEDPRHKELDAALAALKAAYEVQTPDTTSHTNFATMAVSNAHVHPERMQMLESKKPLKAEDDQDVEKKRWVPTGSNVLPLGAKTEQIELHRESLEDGEIAPVSSEIAKSLEVTKAPSTRFLPPPGPYYDQNSLGHVFRSAGFLKREPFCGTCWTKHSTGSADCQKICTMCGTNDHPGKDSSLLFCSVSWYKGRKVAKPSDGQLRPTGQDLSALFTAGWIKESPNASSHFLVNKSNPEVARFYQGTWPEALWKKPKVQVGSTKNVAAHATMPKSEFVPRPMSTKTSTQTPSFDSNMYTTLHSRTLATATPEAIRSVAETQGQIVSSAPNDIRTHLQELQEQITMLKVENLMRDREIRLLKEELLDLRRANNEVQQGNKRKRLLEGDSTVLKIPDLIWG